MMYKKMLYAIVLLLIGVSIQQLNAEQSVTVGNIQWNIWPSNNTWGYNSTGYGCSYHIMDLSHNGSRSLVGRYTSAGDHDTLIYFVLYKCQLLDSTGSNVSPGEEFVTTYIHKMYVRNNIKIPLLNIDSIANFCETHTCDAEWIPISEDSLREAGFIQDPVFAASNSNVNVDPICDSMWAGVESYLAAPINPLLDAYNPEHLNNLYGEYRFVIDKQDGGIDELKPVFGVYSPFFINIWKNDQTGEVEKWYEYDLEFFPKKLTIYKEQGNNLIRWERPYQYVLTKETNIPDMFVSPDSDTIPDTLRTFDDNDFVEAIFQTQQGSNITINITDSIVNEEKNKYLYGHYILQPGAIRRKHSDDQQVSYYLIKNCSNLHGIIGQDTLNSSYCPYKYIHHSGLGKAFNTTTYPLENTTTHFLAWLPGEMKAYGYNGYVETADSPPYLFHYVRHNSSFNAEIFNRDSLPWVKVLHSQYYYLVMEVKIVRNNKVDSIYISWVDSSNVASDGFNNLAGGARISWRLWWQDPHVLLDGEGKYDSLFADKVSYAFSWKPFIQLHRVGDTLFWNSFIADTSLNRRNTLQINYIVWKNSNGPIMPVPDTTSDTFFVIPGLSDTTCFMFQVQYNDSNLSYTSEPALTWYPSLSVDSDYVVTWPKCPCADFYEVWTKKASSEDWSIDTTKDTYYKISGYNTEETIVKVRAVKNQFPMAWGIIGHLNPPTNVKAKLIQADFSWQDGVVHVTWTDNSNMEDGYLLEYKFDSQSTWIQKWLPTNSTSCNINVSHLSNYRTIYVRVYPILYANPIDKAGEIYINHEGDSTIITLQLLTDNSYITNNLAGCSNSKKATLITEDSTVYTLGQNNIVENGKGIESSIDVNENCDFVTLWNTGDKLFIQITSDNQLTSHLIYEVEDNRFQRISGIAVNIDDFNNIHVAALLYDDNPHYITEKIHLLYGNSRNPNYFDMVWDTVFSILYKGIGMDMYGITSTPDGNHILINYSIDSILYTCKVDEGNVDSIFTWKNYKNIYNPIYWPSAGSFWFAYLDVNDTLGLISIPIDSSKALVSNWKHYLPVEGNVHIEPTVSGNYLGVAAPFPLVLSPSSSANAVELSLLDYETNDSVSQLISISINTTERIDNFMGFLSFIKIDTIPDTLHSPIPGYQSISIDTIWRGYISFRGEDSLYHVDSFNVTLNANSAKGGIQSAQGSLVFPYVDFNRTILNSKTEDLELSIYSPGAQNGSAEIYDITGRKLWHRDILLSKNSVNRVRISFKRFPQGIYFVRVKIGDRLFTKKILSIR